MCIRLETMTRERMHEFYRSFEYDTAISPGKCTYVYDPEKGEDAAGVRPGTDWKDVPEDFVCPVCGLGKEDFEEA